jgi:hypothetical protein
MPARCRRGGQPKYNGKREQCTAGVGTLLLEFGLLSRLSLDSRFEEAAMCALRLLWSKRSTRDLLGESPPGHPSNVAHLIST